MVARVRGVRGSKEVVSNGLTLRMAVREKQLPSAAALSQSIHNTTAESDEFAKQCRTA